MATGGRDLGSFVSALRDLDIDKISRTAIGKTAERISELNVDQLRAGFSSKDQRFKRYRRKQWIDAARRIGHSVSAGYKDYAEFKNAVSALPGLGNPDFILTGEFTKHLETEVTASGTIGTHSYAAVAPDLEARDGADNIYGLGPDRHKEYVEEDLQPAFMEEINKALNG